MTQLPLTAELGPEIRPEVPKRRDIWFVLAWSVTSQMWRIPPGSWGFHSAEYAERFIKERLSDKWRGACVVRVPGDEKGAT